jgi:Flp pilus assembly protein TadB
MGVVAMIAAAAVGVGTAAYAANEAENAQYEANQNAKAAASENRKIQSEQKAQNDATAAAERRKQIREERIRRARIQQAAQNTGTSGSAGELGAVGGLSTNLSSGIGFNIGAQQSAANISVYAQSAANFDMNRQNAMQDLEKANQMFSLGTSIFMNAGGIGSGVNQGMSYFKGT